VRIGLYTDVRRSACGGMKNEMKKVDHAIGGRRVGEGRAGNRGMQRCGSLRRVSCHPDNR
jgi:hypothetical protein